MGVPTALGATAFGISCSLGPSDDALRRDAQRAEERPFRQLDLEGVVLSVTRLTERGFRGRTIGGLVRRRAHERLLGVARAPRLRGDAAQHHTHLPNASSLDV